MSKESLDYQKLCSNYYSSWEEGCCMESCEFYNHNECPVVYVNGLLEERDKTIADLEAKLAEKDTKLHEYIRCALEDYNDNIKEIIELKQQLAESEKALQAKESVNQMYKATLNLKDSDFSDLVRENAKLKQQLAEKDDRISRLQFEVQQALSNSLGKTIKELIEFDNQAKISFTVEQLEKVKEYIDNHKYKTTNDDRYVVYRKSLVDIIDNQIKQLKEVK